MISKWENMIEDLPITDQRNPNDIIKELKMNNINVSLLSKKRANLNTCLDILSQFRFTLDSGGLIPQSISTTYEQLYALVYHEMKRADADIESLKNG